MRRTAEPRDAGSASALVLAASAALVGCAAAGLAGAGAVGARARAAGAADAAALAGAAELHRGGDACARAQEVARASQAAVRRCAAVATGGPVPGLEVVVAVALPAPLGAWSVAARARAGAAEGTFRALPASHLVPAANGSERGDVPVTCACTARSPR